MRRRGTVKRATMKVKTKQGAALRETFIPGDCLVCSDPAHYSGCLGCGQVIARRAGWCSEACMNADIIGAARAPQRSEAQTW